MGPVTSISQTCLDLHLDQHTDTHTHIYSHVEDKAKENPGCVERFVCEMYKTGETMSGIPYILMSITNAAVSYTVAEQFNQSIEMEAITRSSRIGRSDGT